MAQVTKQVTYTADDLDTGASFPRRLSFVLEADAPIGELVVQADVIVNGERLRADPIQAADLTGLSAAQKTSLRDLLVLVYNDRRDAVLAAAEGTPV